MFKRYKNYEGLKHSYRCMDLVMVDAAQDCCLDLKYQQKTIMHVCIRNNSQLCNI